MIDRVEEAAVSVGWIVLAGGIAVIWWAAKRYATRHSREEPRTVTDPVCGMSIEAAQAAATSEYEGKTYYFCAEACQRQFAASPAKYVKS